MKEVALPFSVNIPTVFPEPYQPVLAGRAGPRGRRASPLRRLLRAARSQAQSPIVLVAHRRVPGKHRVGASISSTTAAWLMIVILQRLRGPMRDLRKLRKGWECQTHSLSMRLRSTVIMKSPDPGLRRMQFGTMGLRLAVRFDLPSWNICLCLSQARKGNEWRASPAAHAGGQPRKWPNSPRRWLRTKYPHRPFSNAVWGLSPDTTYVMTLSPLGMKAGGLSRSLGLCRLGGLHTSELVMRFHLEDSPQIPFSDSRSLSRGCPTARGVLRWVAVEFLARYLGLPLSTPRSSSGRSFGLKVRSEKLSEGLSVASQEV